MKINLGQPAAALTKVEAGKQQNACWACVPQWLHGVCCIECAALSVPQWLHGVCCNSMLKPAPYPVHPQPHLLLHPQQPMHAQPSIHLVPVPPLPAAGRNFVRGVLLGLFATCAGLVLFSFPEALYKVFGISLPISSGTAVCGALLALDDREAVPLCQAEPPMPCLTLASQLLALNQGSKQHIVCSNC